MKRLAVVLSLLLAAFALAALAQDQTELIRKTKRYLSVFPEDDLERLNLAWLYMLAEQPDSALVHYDVVARRDPQNALAASGGLWALNSLGRFGQSVKRAEPLLASFEDNADIWNHAGLASLKTFSPLKARQRYLKATKLAAAESDAGRIAADGLAWSYLYLGDHANAKAVLNPELSAFPVANRNRYTLSLGAGFKKKSDRYFLGGLGWRRRMLSLAAGIDEYRYRNRHYRTAYSLDLDKQLRAFSLRLSAKNFSGADASLYPAWQGGIGATRNAYADGYRLRPRVGFRYTYTPNFSVAQGDIGLEVGNDRLGFNLIYSSLYRDNLPIESDTWGGAVFGSAELRLWQDAKLSLSASGGDLEWLTNPWGVTLDTNYANDANFGLGLYLPLGSRFGISLYTQLGLLDDDTNFLAQSVASVSL